MLNRIRRALLNQLAKFGCCRYIKLTSRTSPSVTTIGKIELEDERYYAIRIPIGFGPSKYYDRYQVNKQEEAGRIHGIAWRIRSLAPRTQ